MEANGANCIVSLSGAISWIYPPSERDGLQWFVMKQRKPLATKPPRVLDPIELAHVTGGDGDAAIVSLKQHVDNPGQTAM